MLTSRAVPAQAHLAQQARVSPFSLPCLPLLPSTIVCPTHIMLSASIHVACSFYGLSIRPREVEIGVLAHVGGCGNPSPSKRSPQSSSRSLSNVSIALPSLLSLLRHPFSLPNLPSSDAAPGHLTPPVVSLAFLSLSPVDLAANATLACTPPPLQPSSHRHLQCHPPPAVPLLDPLAGTSVGRFGYKSVGLVVAI